MCVIAYRPPGKKLTRDTMLNCWAINSDGAGFMYIKDGKVVVTKGFMKFKHLSRAFADVPDDSPVVVHFRIRTHGGTDPENTHPFVVTEGKLAIAHNGILPIEPPKDSNMSDTAAFAALVLKRLPWGWHRNVAMLHLLDNYCGHGNKLAIMDYTGKVTLINEEAGIWDEGVWFSNSSFRRYSYRTPSAGYNQPYGGWDDEGYGGDFDKDGFYVGPSVGSTGFPLNPDLRGPYVHPAATQYHDPHDGAGVARDEGVAVNNAVSAEHTVRRNASNALEEGKRDALVRPPSTFLRGKDIGDIDDKENFLSNAESLYNKTKPYRPFGMGD